jgi:hypothetical protein
MNWQHRLVIVAALLAAGTMPYLLAFGLSGTDHVFGGFLLNPIDGNTYLAKMQMGYSGQWRFHLPYSAEAGDGAFLFGFYIAAGHLARLMGLPLVAVFHLLRAASGVLLALVVMSFLARALVDRPGLARTAAWLALFGSGMGWLVVFAGLLPSDLWVAETYPFLSMYANPHFPLGLALLLWGLRGTLEGGQPDGGLQPSWLTFVGVKDGSRVVSETYLQNNPPGQALAALNHWQPATRKPIRLARGARLALLAVDGLLLAIILPFGVVVLAVIVVGVAAWQWLESRWLDWQSLAALLVPGGLFLIYQYWAVLSDPVLASWNAQNITPAPAPWDFLLSLSPVLPLAVAGGVIMLGRGRGAELRNPLLRACLVWAVAGAVLVYLPFPLQRRFMLGYYLPLAVLAMWAIDWLTARLRGSPRWPLRAAFALALPTNLIVLVLALFGVFTRAPELYLTRAEAGLLDWLRRETPPGALVLASPEMGLYIPAHTGQRVIYGHPFETVDALEEEKLVNAFYQGDFDPTAVERFLVERGVDYIIVGERERLLGELPNLTHLPVAFEQGEDRIYLAGIMP